MAGIITLLAVLVPLTLFYLYSKLYRLRFEQYRDVPQPPNSLLFGHLKVIGQLMAKGNPTRHTDYVFHEIGQSLGTPPFHFFDLRPAGPPMISIMSHEVAEQISRATTQFRYSIPKSTTLQEFIDVTGSWSIILITGEKWKSLRRRFNPGFAPQHLNTLLPRIVQMTARFVSRLDGLAESGKEFALSDLCTSFTFDVIGAVTMDVDLGAQGPLEKQSPIVRHYQDLLKLYFNSVIPVNWVTAPLTSFRRYRYRLLVDAELARLVKAQYDEQRANSNVNKKDSGRSVLSLSLKDVDEITTATMKETIDSLKSFLFAGHDTTSTLLQWTFYELSRHPNVLETLRRELDEVFGPNDDPEVVMKILVERGEEVLAKLSYTSAIMKEALRLFPPAGSARMAPPGSGFTLKTPNGKEVCLDGVVLYNCHYSIHRDPAVYGDTADDFIPDRWLGNLNTHADEHRQVKPEQPTDSSGKDIPATAWRPFERGPRNCIGQEVANIETRVVLACVARRFDFQKVGMGALLVKDGKFVLNEKGQYEAADPLLNTRNITSKPMDGMMMTVKVHST